MKIINISGDKALKLIESSSSQHLEEAARVLSIVDAQRTINNDASSNSGVGSSTTQPGSVASSQVRVSLVDAEALANFVFTVNLLSKKQIQLG